MVLALPPPPPAPAIPPRPRPPHPVTPSTTSFTTIHESGETTKRIQSNVNLEFRNTSPSSLCDRIASLLATLLQADPTITIDPLPSHPSLPKLTTPTEVPLDTPTFHQYVSPGKPTRGGTKFHLFLTSTLRINQLKSHPTVHAHLRSSNIWLRYNTISSTDITAVGWMFRVNPDAYSRQELYDHMIAKLDNKFTSFQLNARTITYPTDPTITTRAWVLEMDKSHAKEWFPILLETFPIGTTGPQLIPFSAAQFNRDQSIKKVFYLHNKSLADGVLIRIDNLRGLDQKLKSNDGSHEPTLRQSLLDQRSRSSSADSLFFSVSQYNSGRVTLLLKKAYVEEAYELLDYFLDTYIPSLHPESQSVITFPHKKPIRIGRPHLPEHIAIVKRAIEILPDEINLDDESQITTLSSPPSKYHRNHRSYATVTAPSTTTPASTHTPAVHSNATNIDSLLASLTAKTQLLARTQQTTTTKINTIEQNLSTITAQISTTIEQLNTLHTIITAQQRSIAQLTQVLTQLDPAAYKSPTSSPQRKNPRTTHLSPHLSSLSEPFLTPPSLEDKLSFDHEPPDDVNLASQQ